MKIYRVRINIIGYKRAGKTSFIRSLLGKPFLENMESTEGIHTQVVRTEFDLENRSFGSWDETEISPEGITRDFNMQVLAFTSVLSSNKLSTDDSFEKPKHDHGKGTGTSSVPEVIGTEQEHLGQGLQMDSRTVSQLFNEKLQPSKKKAGTECLIRLWDHGGQFEFSATHNLFLDADAINIIAMDITKPLDEVIQSKFNSASTASIPQTCGQFLDHWIGVVLQRAKMRRVHPTLILVLTHKDEFTGSVEDYISGLLKYTKGKPYEKYVKRENIFVVDNKQGTKEDFLDLRNRIFQLATLQKSWAQERPIKWLKLEASIHDEAQVQHTTHLKIDQVQQLASKLEIENNELDSFLQFHHSMGDLIHFKKFKLDHLVITDPQWLVDMLKALVTHHDFLDKRNIESEILEEYKQTALVTETLLQIVWRGNDVQFLTHLLQRFQLLIPIKDGPSTKYLVPSMLPPTNPNLYEAEPFRSMKKVYSTQYMAGDTEKVLVEDFHRLVAACAEKWKLCDFDHFTYSDISFKYRPGVRISLTLLGDLRINVWYNRQAIRKGTLHILPSIQKEIQESLEPLELYSEDFQLPCPHYLKGCRGEEFTACCMVKFRTSALEDLICPEHQRSVDDADYRWFFRSQPTAVRSEIEPFPSLTSLGIGEFQMQTKTCFLRD